MSPSSKYEDILFQLKRLLTALTGKRQAASSVPGTLLTRSQWALASNEIKRHLVKKGMALNQLKSLRAEQFYDARIDKFAQYIAQLWERAERQSVPAGKGGGHKGRRKITKDFVPDSGGVESTQPESSPDVQASALIDIFYATNRGKGDSSGVNERYGAECNETLTLGTATISIPHNHKRGEIERPSIFRFEFSENPRKHLMLRRIDEIDEDEFFSRVRQRRKDVGDGQTGTAVVFVHGYNVSFAEGARRCAQISYDMFLRTKSGNEAVLSCVPILFSWPSHGSTLPYLHDGRNAEVSAALFQQFLIDLSKKTGASDIVVLAHSMGSRPVIAAIEKIGIGKMLGPKNKLREMILAAPDFDRGLFLNAAQQVMRAVTRVTLYASGADKALAASKHLHGFARLGDADGGICTAQGMDSIDATSAGDDVLGHSNFTTSKVMLDIYDVVVNRRTTSQRTFSLLPVGNPPTYWQIKP